jgi:acyl phosphate:glycerol-3-phosphate acyltransferase
VISLVGVFLVSAFLGAIPFGLLVTKCLGRDDPREGGSGNIGATNVLRTSGWATALLTLAGDILKGSVSVAFVPGLLIASPESLPATGLPATGLPAAGVAAIAAVLGHMYSPFTGFNGGKGVATGLGVFALLMPVPTALSVGVFIATVSITRYVSLGSCLAALVIPIAAVVAAYPSEKLVAAVVISALIILRHKDNIGRLIRGEENRFGTKKS